MSRPDPTGSDQGRPERVPHLRGLYRYRSVQTLTGAPAGLGPDLSGLTLN